jgi:uncharacterized protein
MIMELTHDPGTGNYHIRAYGRGFIQINDEKIDHSLIVTPDKLMTWPPHAFSELNTSHFLPLFDLQPSIVLLGTGQRLSFPEPALLADFYIKKIGIEIMDTAAACRTYTILMAEGRKVAAALFVP